MQTPAESTVIQSRPSISDRDRDAAHCQGPVPLFDYHLRLLTDLYLNFFQERRKIEETYVESLTKLHRRTKSLDALFDDCRDMVTTRSAWAEVRDNVEREAQTRQAFLATLTADVVNSLTSLKETQERTRKRIKEDLKESGNAYNDYAEGTLPKLKRTYMRKCQEVDDHKAAAAQPHSPRPDHAHPLSPTEQQNHPFTNSKSNPSLPSRPVVTSPQPLRPLDRRPSGSMPAARNRSPSTSTAFSDLASHGKKQLNQLITFLDKSGTVKESLGGRSDNHAMRAVRSKREAEEADKEYRKGIHWLETLRLRRTKILEAGYTSLERFVHDSASTVKVVLEKYTDNLIATTTTETQLCTHVRQSIDRISPTKDVQVLSQSIPKSLASAIPKPILYYNYSVGECSDLIFGVSLVDYATARSLSEGEVPKIIRICTKEVDSRGLQSEGIYRVSGRHANVQELQHKIERNEAAFEFNQSTDDVFAVSSLLKMYLRELPEPVFRYPLQDRIQHTEDLADHQINNFVLLRSKMRRLPPVHQATLKAVVEHLARVAAQSEKNKMDVKNLAIVFGGVIFGEDEIPKGGNLLSIQTWKDTLMEDLITHAAVLFDDRAPAVVPTAPLPPAPAGQAAPSYAYGSAHTKVATVPRPPQTPVREKPQQLPQSPEDFTPRLPPRPANSIHPSSRAYPTSPTRATMEIPPPVSARSASGPKPAAIEKTSPPRPTQIEKLPPPAKPIEETPALSDTASSPTSPYASSTLVATQEGDEVTAITPEPHQESTPPSPIPPPKSPQMPKPAIPSLLTPGANEATKGSGDDSDTDTDHSPDLYSVPAEFPSL